MVKKYRISTTISPRHYEMLKKHSVEYDSQQSLLEHALESLDNSTQTGQPSSREEEAWIRIGRDVKTSVVIFQKDIIKLMTDTADLERYREYNARHKPYEFATQFYYQKPLKDCTLPELLDVLIVLVKIQNTYESINYTDEGDHYMLKWTHKWGLNLSKVMLVMCESLFESYGVKTESIISENSIFTRIYKNG